MLSRKEIDVIGQNIVGDFMPEALKSPQEIDIDLLAQDYLGMDQDFQYLSHCGVYLGMTVFNDTDKVPVYDPQNNCADYISAKAHTVIIDKTLLEENQEHRYRFTMGHEAGHEFLHKEYFAYDPVPCGHKEDGLPDIEKVDRQGLDGMAGKCTFILNAHAGIDGAYGDRRHKNQSHTGRHIALCFCRGSFICV